MQFEDEEEKRKESRKRKFLNKVHHSVVFSFVPNNVTDQIVIMMNEYIERYFCLETKKNYCFAR
jgi:hypothetical protein